jgi:CHAT domain-containing protein
VGRLRAGGSRAGRTVSYPRATSLFDELQARIASRQWEEAISVGEKLLALAGIRAEEIRALSGFQPRLVIASACETGVIEGYEDADEALSLGSRSSLWAPTGVVSTLWAIDDWATMLLMSRFYELLRDANDPATALREAQLWLQLLRPEQEDAYLATRPLLGASREERQRRSRELRGGRDDANEEPYASLSTWAAFVFTGA